MTSVHDSIGESEFLILAYGNELCGDDAAGLYLAQRLEVLGLPGVRVRKCAQATPELTAELARANLVVFVDASISGAPGSVEMCHVEPEHRLSSLDHALSPGALLGLCEAVFGHRPDAYILKIYVADYDFRIGLSPDGELAVERALETLQEFFRARRIRTKHTARRGSVDL